jgi:hypothetical protein
VEGESGIVQYGRSGAIRKKRRTGSPGRSDDAGRERRGEMLRGYLMIRRK